VCVQEDQGSVREQVASQPTEGLQDGAGSAQSDLSGKVNQLFLIHEEFQSGAVAKSYMRKGFLIYEEMRKYFPI
jgi:hypothetical protein